MIIASSGIIIKNKKILLIKRSNYTKVFPGLWACPGGRADSGETPEENVIREVKEETNIDFTPTQLFKKGNWKDRDLYRFLGKWSGKVKPQVKEISEIKWFSYNKAAKLNFAFDYKEVLDMLHQKELI